MSRFVNSEELNKIELGDGDWVKVPSQISYEMLEKAGIIGNESPDPIKMLSFFIKEWNLKNPEGSVVEISEKSIKSLNMETFKILSEKVAEAFALDQKKSEVS